MGMRLYTAKKYDVEYADRPLGGYNVSNDIIALIRHSETGYVSENELDMEIDKDELQEIRDTDKYPNLNNLIDRILQETDPNNNFIHLSIF